MARNEFTKNKLYYTSNFSLDKEDITVDPDGTLIAGSPTLTRTLDRKEEPTAPRRSNGWDLKNGTPVEHGNTYTYKPLDGWPDTVTGAGQTFTYGYTTNSADLIATVTNPVLTVSNTWLTDRDALDVKENMVGATSISKYDYAVNAVNQRDGVATSGSAFASASSVAWGYDALGQVVAADDASGNDNDFGFEYDRMGNRKKSSRGTTAVQASSGVMRATYRSSWNASSPQGGNNLNQYGRLDFYGAATILNNTYDDDGNQIEGRFPTTPSTSTQAGNTRAWDGENQLISATVNSGTPTVYTYDAYHRRVAKRTSATDVTYTVYDAWNPVAEYTRPASTFLLQTSYTWGKDLSGSMQGAGGVGGLLAVQKFTGTTGTYLPTYDGNGNVSEYLSTTGAIVAHFEYGPFGEQTVASGSQAADFKHRFSTKPLDAESGYYYYGYRSYDPLSGRWVSRDPIGEFGGVNLYGMLGNEALNEADILGMGPCEDKFKSRLKNITKDIVRHKKRANAHRKEVTKRTREFADDGKPGPDGEPRPPLKGNGKRTPPYPPSETRNGHADLIDFHKAHQAAAEAFATAAIQEFQGVMAEYVACKTAEKAGESIIGKCCKGVGKKFGAIVFFAWDCSQDGAQAAVDNLTWPVSEVWSGEDMPSLNDVDRELKNAERYEKEEIERDMKRTGNFPGYLPPGPGAPPTMVYED